MLYLKNLKLFEALYEAEGKNLVQAIDSIREAVAKGGEPFKAVQSLLSNRNPGRSEDWSTGVKEFED